MAVKLNLETSAFSPLPAAIANPRHLMPRDGAHGVTRPPCPKVAKNDSTLMSGTLFRSLGEPEVFEDPERGVGLV